MPALDSPATARKIVAAVDGSLEQAYRISQARLDAAERPTGDAEPASLVRNTFNVSVSLAAGDTPGGLDPTALEDALTTVLRAAARRHGLET